MIRRLRYIILAACASVALSSCIENDVPYPVVKLDILSITVEGIIGEPEIDPTAHTVDVVLEETTDIRNVNITDVVMTEGATSNVTFPGRFDLRYPQYVVLSMYQDYEWTISAEQHIERYFRVEGQIGESVIDPASLIATAYVPMDTDLSAVKITAVKLGPKDICSYAPDPMSLVSFEDTVRHVTVTYHGDIVEDWTLCVVPTDVEVEFTSVDAWAKRIWLYAQGREGADLGFKYRKAGDEEWLTLDDIKVNGGSFSGCITGLETLTEYEVVALSGDSETPVVNVTTEDTFTLINGGFEDWSVVNGVVYPYADGSTPFWGTGNDGAAIASTTLTEPTTDIRPDSTGTKAASLQSKKAAVMGIGKFAAGNIFLGEFGGLQGLDGLVNFGRPCTARPVALHGWVKYNCGAIDEFGRVPSSRPDLKKGDNDEGQIMIAVGNWSPEEYGGSADCPVTVNTKDESTYFNINGKSVIGAAEMILTESTNGWVEFTLPLEYRTTSVVPTHIVIVCTGSRFGDYFTGSTHSLMIVDDLELIY